MNEENKKGEKMKLTVPAIIVKWPKGYVAHVRFPDGKGDADLSASTPGAIKYVIDKHIKERNEKMLDRGL